MKNLSFLILLIVFNLCWSSIQVLNIEPKKIDIEQVFKIVSLQHYKNNLIYNEERREVCDIECQMGQSLVPKPNHFYTTNGNYIF
jgi:hypothetical protein